jgi:hypothetical protein
MGDRAAREQPSAIHYVSLDDLPGAKMVVRPFPHWDVAVAPNAREVMQLYAAVSAEPAAWELESRRGVWELDTGRAVVVIPALSITNNPRGRFAYDFPPTREALLKRFQRP